MKKFFCDIYYNSAYRKSLKIFLFLCMIFVVFLICLNLINNTWKIGDYIFALFFLFVNLAFFIFYAQKRFFIVDNGYIKCKNTNIDISKINYVIITQRYVPLTRGSEIVPLYEKNSNDGKKIVIARMLFQDEFYFDKKRCENSIEFEHSSDIRLSYYNTLFKTDYQQNLLETLFEQGLKSSFFIKKEAYEDRKHEFDILFQIYKSNIKEIKIF